MMFGDIPSKSERVVNMGETNVRAMAFLMGLLGFDCAVALS
jgi:hypothetical protein